MIGAMRSPGLGLCRVRLSRSLVACAALLASLLALPASGGEVQAQARPDTENGRYTLSPSTDGFIRLDTRTGFVASCTDKGAGWACYTLPDERAAFDSEIGRLQTENEALKARLAEQSPTVPGKIDEPLPKQDSLKPAEPKVAEGGRKIEIPKIEIPLPNDRDMDRMMGFIENAWRRLVDMANRMQRDASGRI
jgi:hypothetical protein